MEDLEGWRARKRKGGAWCGGGVGWSPFKWSRGKVDFDHDVLRMVLLELNIFISSSVEKVLHWSSPML